MWEWIKKQFIKWKQKGYKKGVGRNPSLKTYVDHVKLL